MGTTHPCGSEHTDPAEGRAIFSLAGLRGFSDGFVGSLMGGAIYCLVLVQIQTDELALACLRVVALSLVFGGFETWRVTQAQTLKSARKKLGWTLVAAMLLLFGLDMAVPKADHSTPATPHQAPSLLGARLRSRIALPALATAFATTQGIPRRASFHTWTPRKRV